MNDINAATITADLYGTNVHIEADVFEIGRRIREGDGTLGWGGDPVAALTFNPRNAMFEVIGRDLYGRAYVMASHRKCDERLIMKCRDGHWSKAVDFVDRLIDEQGRRQDELERERREYISEELAPKLAHAIRTENGIRDTWGYGD